MIIRRAPVATTNIGTQDPSPMYMTQARRRPERWIKDKGTLRRATILRHEIYTTIFRFRR
jgi:hypothetical protein